MHPRPVCFGFIEVCEVRVADVDQACSLLDANIALAALPRLAELASAL